MKACALIPCFDHGATVAEVVDAIEPKDLPRLIIDDGSGAATRETLEHLAESDERVTLHRRASNGGKGAALKDGFRIARELGFTHVVQIDADGQHCAADVARFVELMKAHPEALVLGDPVFDETAPRSRMLARQLSRASVWLACLSRVVHDPLCGFRGVPIDPALAAIESADTGDRMEFEPELAVRMVWQGTPVISLPTPVRYVAGGLSHFSVERDFPLLAGVYVRLAGGMIVRAPRLLFSRPTDRPT